MTSYRFDNGMRKVLMVLAAAVLIKYLCSCAYLKGAKAPVAGIMVVDSVRKNDNGTHTATVTGYTKPLAKADSLKKGDTVAVIYHKVKRS